MKHLQNNWRFVFLILLYLASRLMLIVQYPLFNDEALTIRYGKIMIDTPNRFYTLAVGGKQPLLFWIDGIMASFMDPLWGGRLVSVVWGFGTLFFLYLIGKKLQGHQAGFLSAVLYIVSPLSLFFDVLAIHDSFLTMIFSAVCFLLLRIQGNWSTRYSLLLGASVALGLWVKSTSLIFLFVICVAYGMWSIDGKRVIKNALLSLFIISIVIGVSLVPLIARPEISGIFAMQSSYALTLKEISQFPWIIWWSNIRDAFLVYIGYVSPILLPVSFYAIWSGRSYKKVLTLGACFLSAVFLLVFLGRSLHGRYLLFSTVPIYALSAFVLWNKRRLALVAIVIMSGLSLLLLTSPSRYFLLFPNKYVWSLEAFQYVTGWPSGYGVMDALRYVDLERAGKNAFIGVRWDAGNPEDTVLIYGNRMPGVVASFLDKKLPNFYELRDVFGKNPMYFITRDGQKGDMDKQLRFLKRFPKPAGRESVEVYQYIP